MHDMRTLIKLVESATAHITNDDLVTMTALLTDWVDVPDAVRNEMPFVYQHWPRPARGMVLHRVHAVTKTQAAKIERGIKVPVQLYSSWTSDLKSLEGLAAARFKSGRVPIIITMEWPPEAICIDLGAFYRFAYEALSDSDRWDLEMSRSDLYSLEKYAHESEVIVCHDGPLVIDASNAKAFKIEASSTRKPKPGELIYPEDKNDEVDAVAEVLQRQHGLWAVVTEHGSERWIRLTADGSWAETTNYF